MNKDLIKSLVVAGGLIAVALVSTPARSMGLIDGDAVTRLVMGATGLMLIWSGNRMPKTFVPAAKARQVQRVGGWSMVLSGLIYAALWAFAPLDLAFTAGCAVVVAGLVATIGYCLTLRRKAVA
jgi:uncharacterized membrane protein